MEEIDSLPEFGGDNGWFYGLIRDDGKIYFGEILPGLGYCRVWPHSFKTFCWAIQDVLIAKRRKLH